MGATAEDMTARTSGSSDDAFQRFLDSGGQSAHPLASQPAPPATEYPKNSSGDPVQDYLDSGGKTPHPVKVDKVAESRVKPNWWEGLGPTPQGTAAVAENALAFGTGVAGQVSGAIGGAGQAMYNVAASYLPSLPAPAMTGEERYHDNMNALTYEPRTVLGQDLSAQLQRPMNWITDNVSRPVGDFVGRVTGSPDLGRGVTEAVPLAGGLGVGEGFGALRGALRPKAPTVSNGTHWSEPAVPATTQDIGSAQTRQPVDISGLTPEHQKLINDVTTRGYPNINSEVLQRRVDALTLPTPVNLPLGAALQDPVIAAREWNERADTGTIPHFVAANDALNSNLAELRHRVGGNEVFADHPTEHGSTLVGAVADRIEGQVLPDIAEKYRTLESVVKKNGNEFPMDTARFVQSFEDDLGPIRTPFLQDAKPLNRALDVLRTGEPVSAGDMLHLRTVASNYATNPNGNLANLGATLLEKIDNAPLASDASNEIRGAWTDAIGAARADFQMQRTYPWYRAVREGFKQGSDGVERDSALLSKLHDNFVANHVTGQGASVSGLSSLHEFLGGNEPAQRTLGVSLVERLHKAASITKNGSGDLVGNFGPTPYNAQLRQLSPKMDAVLDPADAALAKQIGNVAQVLKFQDKSGIYNNSNTAPAARQLAVQSAVPDAATTVAQHAANAGWTAAEFGAAHAIPVVGAPLVGLGRALVDNTLKGRKLAAAQAEADFRARAIAGEYAERGRLTTEPLGGVFQK